MIKRLLYIWLLSCWALGMNAEIVVLQSGKTIEGEILISNEEILMLKDPDGHKFQFPRAEIVEIRQHEDTAAITTVETTSTTKGNCALRLDMGGGALFVPSLSNGGFGAIDIQIGSRRIGQQRVFLGGSVGYAAAFTNQIYHFIPLMAVFSMPLLPGKHAPELGAALGYGFAVKNPSKGGVVAKLDVSWRYQFSSSSALLLGIQARWQQADVKFTEVVDDNEYTSVLGRNFVHLGLRLAMEF